MSDLEIILVVGGAAIAAAVVIGLLKRSSRKRGYGDLYRRESEGKETDDRTKGG
ncbi:MAG: hypothetical protein ABMA26_21940 [Limisphaerales bacterium]